MDINYILLVHKHPEQVNRLVRRLRANNTFFYIHVDKTVPIDPFHASLSACQNLHFVKKREDGKWGSLGIVKAVLHAFEQIREDKRAGYCILLSGQDYPLRSNGEINEFLASGNGCNYADTWALPASRWYHGGLDRIHHYKFDLIDGKRNYTVIPPLFTRDFRRDWRVNLYRIRQLLKQGKMPFRIFRRRTFPGYLKPFGGSQWFAITTQTAENILEFTKANKNYLSYHRYTLLPDEIFFPSLIVHFSFLAKTPVKPSLTYLRWTDKKAAHPVAFSVDHLEELREIHRTHAGKLFARKFNFEEDIVHLIDKFSNEAQ